MHTHCHFCMSHIFPQSKIWAPGIVLGYSGGDERNSSIYLIMQWPRLHFSDKLLPYSPIKCRTQLYFCVLATQAYSIECRCGGEYSITKGQIDTGYNVVPCTTCTLQAQVH